MFAVSLGLLLLLLEGVLRLVPAALPSGTYTMGQRFDEAVQSPVYTGRVIYNKVRRTVRWPNPAGFLDLEHAEAKPPGVARLAFFGDSYVESAQVELEQTFFRLLAQREPPGVEVLAFGISGWGTLHGLLGYRGLADRFDLDRIVYVFVENDPGDNAWSIMRSRPPSFLRRPFAELSDEPPGFALEWHPGMQASGASRLARVGYDRSLLARVVWSRLALLRGYGVAPRSAGDAVASAGRAAVVTDQNHLPATWPEASVREAGELGRRILRSWLDEAGAAGRPLAVLYVPRGEEQLRGEIAESDTWKPWLSETCAALGIPLIDPTPELRAALEAGESVYDDHWSPQGHVAVARALERGL